MTGKNAGILIGDILFVVFMRMIKCGLLRFERETVCIVIIEDMLVIDCIW